MIASKKSRLEKKKRKTSQSSQNNSLLEILKISTIKNSQRKRSVSVRGSHVILERKRRNSLRRTKTLTTKKKKSLKAKDSDKTKSTTEQNLQKTSSKTKMNIKDTVVKKKYLGCKRKRYDAFNRKEADTTTPKKKKVEDTSLKDSGKMTISKKSEETSAEIQSRKMKSFLKKKKSKASSSQNSSSVSCEISGHNTNMKTTQEMIEATKSSPTTLAETLLDKEFSEDSSDDEYKPNEDELEELDDTVESKGVVDEIDLDEPGNLVVEDGQQQPDPVYMTRSKVSYTDQALEDIEQAFIPPDIDLDMYDCVIDDQDWKEFLTEFTKPIDKINTNEDDDTEFIPNLHEEEVIDSEELRRDPGVKVSKKELNQLMGELFDFNEIYDFGGNACENLENINDYVNLKFNETICNEVVHTAKSSTPKKVTFCDKPTSNENSTQKALRENASKTKRKLTPSKKQKNNMSDEINKQIMDEINKEINKYIQINETYVYKGDQTMSKTENYDNYEEYIVIIGNNEPTSEEINKLAQVKMSTNLDDIVQTEGKTKEVANDVKHLERNEEINENIQLSNETEQPQLSIKLVQKTMLSSKQNKLKSKQKRNSDEKKSKKPPKSSKPKSSPNDSRAKYRYLSQGKFKELYKAFESATEIYKTLHEIKDEEELSYHSNIMKYGATLYKGECEASCFKPLPLLEQETDMITTTFNDDRSCEENVNVNLISENNFKIENKNIFRTSLSQPSTHDETETNKTEVLGVDSSSNDSLEPPCRILEVKQEIPSQDTNVKSEIYPHLFDPEDLSLLKQQINQHIQFSLQHYLQTYHHPKLSHLSKQAKHMIETFYTLSRRKPKSSYFNSLNLENAMQLVDCWERMLQNDAFKSYIQQEWDRCICEWRHYADTLSLPRPILTAIINNEAFIYPLLLPKKSFEPKPRKLINNLETNCELNLLVLGLINYAPILNITTKYERYSLFHDVLLSIQRNYLPVHSVRLLSRKMWDLFSSPMSNIVQRFLRSGEVEEFQHFLIDYTKENVVAPRQQYIQLLPPAWQSCLQQI